MKKYIYCFLIFCTLIISYVVYSIHKEKIEIIQFCTHATSFEDINSCRYTGELTYQQRYDMYYRNADKYDNDFFYGGFFDAFQQCVVYSSQCNLHKESVFSNLQDKCAEKTGTNCVADVLNNKKYSREKSIRIFDNYVNHNSVCVYNIDFYHTLNPIEKKQISLKTIQICDDYLNKKNLGNGS